MSKKTKESLSLFMKKQHEEKAIKKAAVKKTSNAPSKKDSDSKNESEKEVSAEEEMSDEEKLEDAKKASRNKAAERDQTEMLKKLLIENVAKYVLVVAVLVIFSLGIIKYGPEVIGLLNGLIFKSIIGSFSK
jgi:Fe2+ transport system protein B